jgi:hypothetical protein
LLRSPQERAQFLRLELLHRFGGLVIDPDVVCRGLVEPVLDGLDIAAASFPDGRADESFLAAIPGHPVVERVLRDLPATAHWGSEPASIGKLLTPAEGSGGSLTLLAPSLVASRGAEGADTIAVRLYERARETEDWKSNALIAEAELASAQAELEAARRHVEETKERLGTIDLELTGMNRARRAARSRPPGAA